MRCFTINVSGQTLDDAEFPRFVAGQLATHQLSPARIGFEIDEADMLVRLDAVERFAAAMKGIGAPLLIDGFARRAVSFSPLRNLGAQFIKVDGRITRKVLASDTARGKLDAILRVGERFGFALVAECVEEQDILMRLKAMGVGYAQGFGISQPHPIVRLSSKGE